MTHNADILQTATSVSTTAPPTGWDHPRFRTCPSTPTHR